MGLFSKKTKDGNLTVMMSHYAGLPNVKENIPFKIILKEDEGKIEFAEAANKNGVTVTLPLSKITNVDYVGIEKIKETNAVKRAIKGGLLFGEAGAVVGAITAKDKKVKTYYREITYVSNGEQDSILFRSGNLPGENGLFKRLKELTCSTDNTTNKNIEL